MRILHLISSLGLFGAEQVLLNLAANMPGVESRIGVLNNLHNPHLEAIAEAKRRGLKTITFTSRGKFDLRTIRKVRRFLREEKIDILHTHNYKTDILGLVAAKMAGIRTVATAHGYTGVSRAVSFYEQLDRSALRFFDRVVVVSDSILPSFPRHKKVVIPNGIDAHEFSTTSGQRLAVREELGLAARDFVIGTVGRLSKEKNQKLLLQVTGVLVTRCPYLKVLIVGAGPELENLKGEVTRAKLEGRVIFAGLRTDMPHLYSAMDVFILPSLTEGVPLTILEAMAAGVPVIATRVGGIPQMIEEGETGLLVPPQNERALQEKIESLIRDSALRSQLSRQALEMVKEKYSVEIMGKEYRKVYDAVLSKKGVDVLTS